MNQGRPETVSAARRHPLGGGGGEGGRELQNPEGSCALCCVQMHIRAGECYGFMRRVIKIASKRLVKLMVQVNCMK